MDRVKNVYWIVWLTCSWKSSVASRIAKETWYQNFKLDHIYKMAGRKLWLDLSWTTEENHKLLMDNLLNKNLDVIEECYKEYFSEANRENILVEWIMPFDREWELDIVLDLFKWKNINIIFLEPEYKKWLSYRNKRKEDGDIYPVELSLEDYKKKNESLFNSIRRFANWVIVFNNPESAWAVTAMILPYQHEWFTDIKFTQFELGDLTWKIILDLGCNKWMIWELCLKSWAKKVIWVDCSKRDLNDAEKRWVETILFDLNNIENIYIQEKVDIVMAISMMHYMKDVDKFIKKCSELANEMFLFEGPITEEIKYSLNKYFNKVEFKWNSIVQDNSIREIYKCYK